MRDDKVSGSYKTPLKGHRNFDHDEDTGRHEERIRRQRPHRSEQYDKKPRRQNRYGKPLY